MDKPIPPRSRTMREDGTEVIPNKDAEFLEWLADRLVFRYKENQNVDFVRATRRIAKCLAAAASEDASLLDTSSPSPTPVQEDFRILLGRQAKMEGMLESIMGELVSLSTQVGHLIEALAEDQDPDEMPDQYLDGSPVR
jgi:hypothetical protein